MTRKKRPYKSASDKPFAQPYVDKLIAAGKWGGKRPKPIECIFCHAKFSSLDNLKVHSATCTSHPAVIALASASRVPERKGRTVKFHVRDQDGDVKFYVSTGEYPDGRVGEIFIKIDKQGSLASGALDGAAIAASLALQWGCPVEEIAHKWRAMAFRPSGRTDSKKYPVAASVLDVVGRWLLDTYGPRVVVAEDTAPAAPAPASGAWWWCGSCNAERTDTETKWQPAGDGDQVRACVICGGIVARGGLIEHSRP